MRYYVYILQCSDQSFYTGVTNNLDRRLLEHQNTINPTSYLYRRRPFNLVYYEHFPDPNQAILWEKRIKGWIRAKKKALIEANWNELQKLSECQNLTHYKHFNKTK